MRLIDFSRIAPYIIPVLPTKNGNTHFHIIYTEAIYYIDMATSKDIYKQIKPINPLSNPSNSGVCCVCVDRLRNLPLSECMFLNFIVKSIIKQFPFN